jgi:hypothetical protein
MSSEVATFGVILNRKQYNQHGFVTNYGHEIFFVIKSYNEDDVHKSIKYNVWANTPTGNKRLYLQYYFKLRTSWLMGSPRNILSFFYFQ